jgi:copper chaperone
MANTTISIVGMTCSGCVQSVVKALQSVPGVLAVDVSLEEKRAAVTYDEYQVKVEYLQEAIEEAGYDIA